MKCVWTFGRSTFYLYGQDKNIDEQSSNHFNIASPTSLIIFSTRNKDYAPPSILYPIFQIENAQVLL